MRRRRRGRKGSEEAKGKEGVGEGGKGREKEGSRQMGCANGDN